MSKRQICPTCSKPLKSCICKLIQPVNNVVPLIILQHPLETREAKNTAGLLNLSLHNSELYIGEQFNADFWEDRMNQPFYDILLYPETPEEKSLGIASPPAIDEKKLTFDENLNNSAQLRLWVLDATWRKSRKMLYLNQVLQTMPRLSLQNCPPSIYKIRKAHSENQLSTLEASCYALQQIEGNRVDYSPLLAAFATFIAERQAFLPTTFSIPTQDQL